MIDENSLTTKSEINSRLRQSFVDYQNLAVSCNDEQVLVGRNSLMKVNEEYIFQDICSKLSVGNGEKILSIGVGCGQIAKLWLRKAIEMELALHFNDFPKVINKIKSDILPLFSSEQLNLTFVDGIFPYDIHDNLVGLKFDCIDLYSVIHCSDEPLMIIESAVSLLSPGGRLLIGDIPNLDKKGRFLSSNKGRLFEANYKGITVDNVRVYKNHNEFTSQALIDGAPKLDDDLVVDILMKYRKKGFDAYLLNQPTTLPFCYTREDILIVAPNE